MDAVSKLAVREFIKKQNQEHKTTVILTTHDMQDIAALANRVILIGKGRILLDGSLEDMWELAMQNDLQTENGNQDTGLDAIVAKLYRQLDIL